MKSFVSRWRDRTARLLVKRAGKYLVQELYLGLLKRESDPAGLAAFTAAIRKSGRLAPVVKLFLDSKEFRAKHAVPLPPAKVAAPPPKPAAVPPPPEPALALSTPDLVNQLFKGLLKRDADPDGLKRAMIYLRANDNDLSALIKLLIGTEEFRNKLFATPRALPKTFGAAAVVRPAKRRLIVVSSNCQTAGMAAALQGYFPDDIVQPIPFPEQPHPLLDDNIVMEVQKADVWVTSNWQRLWGRISGPKNESRIQLVKLPVIRFRAFHPDLCYAWKASDGQGTAMHYSSAIAAWAFNHGLTVGDAAKLFNRENFAALGYLDLWNPNMSVLREDFETCGLDFARFILNVKRRGVFMYSIDHPQVDVIVELARLVALKMGATEAMLEKSLNLRDGLTGDIWPVYPEIADEFSLPYGSYNWKLWNEWIQGLGTYLELAFNIYASEGVPAGGLRLQNRDEALYDRVLGPRAKIPKR